MLIDLKLENNFFSVKIENDIFNFDTELLNFIFIKDRNINILSISNECNLDILDLHIKESDTIFIFCYNINPNFEIPSCLIKYKFLYISYIKLGYFWYGIIENDLYKDEYIENIFIGDKIIDLNRKSDCKLMQEYDIFQKKIEEIRNNINNCIIKDLEYKYNNIEELYLNLKNIIKKVELNYKNIFEILNNNINNLQLIEEDKKKNINSLQIKNQLDTKIGEKKQKLENLFLSIKKQENYQKKINNANKIINSKNKQINELNIELENLTKRKNDLISINKKNHIILLNYEKELLNKKKKI